jgi:two-component system CheB/CheR fusion protein
VIGRQAEHLTRLVDDLLDVTRIARGKIQLRTATLDLVELARRTIEDHAAMLARDGVELEVELPAAPVWVEGDPTRIAQVLGNLVGNAAKFSDPGGRVNVRLEAGDAAVVRVRDQGIGIAPDMLARLFVPFAQADETLARTRSRGGLGLGLALVRMLVELHGGTVEAHSAGLGAGAEFVVRLPLATRTARHGQGGGAGATAGRRVLVVEDNPDAGETLRELLGLEGHEVQLARTGEEGLALARTFRPDVVLCDLGLPGMDGFAFARAARAEPSLSTVALVALSGYAHEDDRRRAEAAGFVRHIRKPATLDDLRAAMAAA